MDQTWAWGATGPGYAGPSHPPLPVPALLRHSASPSPPQGQQALQKWAAQVPGGRTPASRVRGGIWWEGSGNSGGRDASAPTAASQDPTAPWDT